MPIPRREANSRQSTQGANAHPPRDGAVHGSAQKLHQGVALRSVLCRVLALQLVQVEEFPLHGRQVNCLRPVDGRKVRVPVLECQQELLRFVVEAKRQLHAEADYAAEARSLARFGALLEGSESFALPALHADLCAPQVLAMRFMDSAPLDSLVDAPQTLRDRVAAALIDLVLRELFLFGAMQTDPNLANYRFDPATGRIVLLDFGAVQPIAQDLSADFRALAQVALDGGHAETRDAMLRIGYFGRATAPHQQELIQAMFDVAMGPLRQDAPFDFGRSDLFERALMM